MGTLCLTITSNAKGDTSMCTHTWERLAESKRWVCILCGLGPSERPAVVSLAGEQTGAVKLGTTTRPPVTSDRRA